MTAALRGILCDLDGVVYRGDEPCDGATEGLASAREAGVRILYMTNNASRTPAAVADQLGALGVPAGPEDVLTASQVAATEVASMRTGGRLTVGPERPVLALGGAGVGVALEELGLAWISTARQRERSGAGVADVSAVVQGYGPELDVQDLTEAAYAIRSGAVWIATNDDTTLPTARGLAVGNGSLVAAVRTATGATPTVVGKPYGSAYQVALDRLGLTAGECLMIGDRLDTDIAGASRAGVPSALVLTGVSTAEEVVTLAPSLRPGHVVETIGDLAHLWERVA
ncbi:HAD-IIA family hydrolase [Ornithinimicrobium sp. W1679]|uniref:HAD-IIA family hydrolase n=1 Tax=Ornithinimicrobium sp. W1679 TaxID=3418770 RepID=UPI003CE986DA